MTSKEAMIHQLKNLKGKPLKKKLEHIFTYFWLNILVAVAIIVFAAAYIIHLANAKEPGLMVACINAYSEQGQVEEYLAEFAEQANIDLNEYEVELSTDMIIFNDNLMGSYQTIQALSARVAAQTIDVIALDFQTLSWYIYQDTFADLSQVLDPEQQAQYEQYYLYADMSVLKALDELPEGKTEYPDPTKPELMKEPVPVALRLPESGQFQRICYPYMSGEVAIGVLSNSLNAGNALAFLDYIMQ